MSWMRSYSGHAVSYLTPDSREIDVADIALALSRAPRFSGHTKEFYSVAQHSVFVYRIVCELFPSANSATKIWALLHDAHEAYTGDISTPLKHAIHTLSHTNENPVSVIEQRLDRAIQTAFLINPAEIDFAAVKKADAVALATEKIEALQDYTDWNLSLEAPLNERIKCLSQESSEALWMGYFCRLRDEYLRSAHAVAAE